MTHRDQYLRQQILSANGPKLRQMLIDRAVRLTVELADAWQTEQFDRASEVSSRLRRILFELWAPVDRSDEPAARPMAALYHFLIGELAAASVRRSAEQLATVREILETERQTWTEVCQKLAAGGSAPGGAGPAPVGVPGPLGRMVRSA